MAKCNLISWRESWGRKGTLGRKQGNLNKLLHLFNNSASKCSLIVAKVPYKCKMPKTGEMVWGVWGYSTVSSVFL